MTTPSPQTWTLRLKAHKTTVLLHVEPLQSFSSIKAQLYDALQETGIKHQETQEQIKLPSSPSDIQLGRPININDASEGFRLGEWEYPTVEEDEDVGKGKGKAKAAKKSQGDLKDLKACPKGASLKDGAVLSFRWVGDGFWNGDDEDMDLEDERQPRNDTEADMWGVQLANFEDAYGVENEVDVGGTRGFEG
ncbi:hypothetical protein IAQ61_010782 [Plenodomus lingam]|uniref:Ubiquitin-like domain-containing protein n=1 Tax=Leptosphaeria maculans (strain JN3 / isolate v23.1.3 / race Av1-4-5-6-7-8) TaxID=985895 RepID=E4ZJZ3_LEPMJ|nr:hypothetical protein LEMA_P069360.1 [Plenodomus lingam JN3]KAH9861046.1 hypothetical protein IAQ61_010782 [Plenodomus lingam]CBX91428.1 hypothetical protein LEMA_P069360.1 [Plenodomus lingam JN3]